MNRGKFDNLRIVILLRILRQRWRCWRRPFAGTHCVSQAAVQQHNAAVRDAQHGRGAAEMVSGPARKTIGIFALLAAMIAYTGVRDTRQQAEASRVAHQDLVAGYRHQDLAASDYSTHAALESIEGALGSKRPEGAAALDHTTNAYAAGLHLKPDRGRIDPAPPPADKVELQQISSIQPDTVEPPPPPQQQPTAPAGGACTCPTVVRGGAAPHVDKSTWGDWSPPVAHATPFDHAKCVNGVFANPPAGTAPPPSVSQLLNPHCNLIFS